MTVTMTTSIVGHGWSAKAGDPHECGEQEGKRLIAAGLATSLKAAPIETANLSDESLETAAIEPTKTLRPKAKAKDPDSH